MILFFSLTFCLTLNSTISFARHKCTHIQPFQNSVKAQKITGISLKIIHIFFTFHIKENKYTNIGFLLHSLALFFLLHLAFLIFLIFHGSVSVFCLVSETMLLPSKYEVVRMTIINIFSYLERDVI